MCTECLCATCVRNAKYAINTPHPCFYAMCDVCEDGDMNTCFCNHHLTIEDVNLMLNKDNEKL